MEGIYVMSAIQMQVLFHSVVCGSVTQGLLIRIELQVKEPSALASSEFANSILGQSNCSHTLKLSGYSFLDGCTIVPFMKRQLAPLLSGKTNLLYLYLALVCMSFHASWPAGELLMASWFIPQTEAIDLRCRTPFITVIAVTGQSGKKVANSSIPAWEKEREGDIKDKSLRASLHTCHTDLSVQEVLCW